MSMREERKIIITMNPDQLRKLADTMELEFPKKAIGNSTFIDFLGYSPELQVCLHADQVWFNDKKKTGCSHCGAIEVDSNSARTVYKCGSSDYDQRKDTFVQACGESGVDKLVDDIGAI